MMPVVTTSEVFDFLEQHDNGTIERHEVASADFGTLRRSLRQIVFKLRDSDDQEALGASHRLRALLSEWLTVPVPFDSRMLDALTDLLGQAEGVQARWGSDIQTLYDLSRRAVADLQSNENPVRIKLRIIICELRSKGRSFKVYCHRRAREHFQSILSSGQDTPLPESAFLHSVRDYRNTAPFDVLIKVGPLRARGWGSAPDALLTAPRFSALVQIVWSGCNDEPDFGYDPVTTPTDSTDGGVTATAPSGSTRNYPITWVTRIACFGEDPGADTGEKYELDELRVFKEMEQPRDKRSATLVQVDRKHGILYPPHSRIVSFDPGRPAGEPVGLRVPGETLLEGMFVIMPIVDDIDLGGLQAEHGRYSEVWKARLRESFESAPTNLIKRLHAAGLNLVNLEAAIRHWCRPPSTVIHAPQQRKHFEILLQVLGIWDEGNSKLEHRAPPFCQLAWNEIRRSRGEAIQAGFQEQEIVEEQLLAVLKKLIPQIRERSMTDQGFALDIPAGHEIHGTFLFFRVCAIEEGFNVPGADLRVVHELRTIDQWRD